MTAPVFQARALTRRFGPRTALDAVDLEVHAGEAVALFGGNGAGKSTLLRLAAGLLRATSGSVLIRGADPRRAPARAHRCRGGNARRRLCRRICRCC